MHKIAVVSDTHGLMRPEVLKKVKECEGILHGGDIDCPEVFEQLKELAPVYAVRGNADKEWAEELPTTLEMELFDKKFLMAHKKKDLPKDRMADIVIYGHSHKYAEQETDGKLYLNPGSCGPRRFHQPITMAVLMLDGNQVMVEKVEIAHPNVGEEVETVKITTMLIEGVCQDVDRGKSAMEIAKRRSIEPDVAEQIVRMYLTHPGVTPEKIMAKMGL